ncbi:MAG: hypothetical protein AMJ73_00855 [candidate division Zixibacteria bacterium SM1_73]|nr:MAG: hypothetical protein AMJ73_00855 [candidate division Zixibacteria bacterium SM1_73]
MSILENRSERSILQVDLQATILQAGQRFEVVLKKSKEPSLRSRRRGERLLRPPPRRVPVRAHGLLGMNCMVHASK